MEIIMHSSKSERDLNSSSQVWLNPHWNFNDGSDVLAPGPRLNIKTILSTYGDFHVKDKTAVRTSYL